MTHTACLVCLVCTVSGCCKNPLGRGSASSRQITKLEQSTFLRLSMVVTIRSLIINCFVNYKYTKKHNCCLQMIQKLVTKVIKIPAMMARFNVSSYVLG
jgi:hypothetical protein